MFSLDKTYLKNIGWQGMGNSAAQAVNILSLPIISRLFSPGELGMLSMFVEALAFVSIVISLRVEHVVMLPRKDREAFELFAFVFSFGILSCILFTVLVVIFALLGIIPSDYRLWALFLPVTAFLMVVSLAVQQLSQRSANFRLSGISEAVNRFSNSLFSIVAGAFGAPGIVLGIAVAVGSFFKSLMFMSYFRELSANLLRASLIGLRRIKRQGVQKLLGSLIFSHGMLAVTSFLPLWFISMRWGNDYVGYFSLVLTTLALPTRLLGTAVGQVFYQRASSTFSTKKPFCDLFISNAKLLFLIAVPGFSIVFFFGPFLYPFVFGQEWGIAGQVAQYYVFAAALSFLSVPFDRSGLIVNAWWYGPGWHLGRLVTTIAVIYFIDLYNATFFDFLFWLTIQASTMYVIDALATYLFSRRTRPFPSKLFV
ncbi:MAG: oligosaccharide flippase family protein [Sedimenticola sp.]|nr:oligosaccharide flippase family protein [Sedimenticola sp.]